MRTHANENVNVIGHAVNLKDFMIIRLKDAGNVLMQPFFPVSMNKSSTIFYGKNKLNVELCVRIGHVNLFTPI